MAPTNSNPLVNLYAKRIGVPSTADEAYGYWLFVIGLILAIVGIALVLITDRPGEQLRGIGIALAAVGLIMLLIGPIVRLPLRRVATLLSYLGALVGLGAVVWFAVEFNAGRWGAAFDHNEVLLIGLYGAGILVIAIGGILTPMLTSPREEQYAAESRAAEAESQREAAIEEAERRAEMAEREAKRAKEESEKAAEERARRKALALELQRIEDSQSQFELYTDNGGRHRWRLRHRNRNIIADSSQGYASRQKAQQGLSAVKRDAFGAAVIDLNKLEDVEVHDVDDAVEGEGAPAFIAERESSATFETYTDKGGKHRWRLRHDNGNIIADSGQGYASKSSRDDAVEYVSHYAQTADYLRIDPAAFEICRDAADKYRWRLLHKNGNILADSGQGYASRQKAKQGIESVKKNVSGGEKATFEVYQDNAGEWRWRFVHRNGNIIADSGEGYASKSGAEDAVDRVTGYAPDAHVLDIGSAAFEIYEDKGGEWRWRLRHHNGRILGDSGEGYNSRSAAEDGIASVKRNAPQAAIAATDD